MVLLLHNSELELYAEHQIFAFPNNITAVVTLMFHKMRKEFLLSLSISYNSNEKKRLGVYICIFFYVYIFELSQAWKISVLPEEISQDFVSN